MKQFIKATTILAVSTVISILAAELVLREFFPRATGTIGRMTAPSGDYLINVSDLVTRQTLGFRRASYTTNSMGFRGKAYDPSIPSVLVLGDSFTYGLLLNESDTLPSRLQALADAEFGEGKFQIINGAVPSWGAIDQVAYLQDYGRRVSPQVIVSMMNYTSISSSYNRALFLLSEDKLVRRTPGTTEGMPYPTANAFGSIDPSPVRRWLYANSQIALLLRQLRDQLRDPNGFLAPEDGEAKKEPRKFDPATVASLSRATADALVFESEKLGAKLIVAEYGFRWQNERDKDGIDRIGMPILLQRINDRGIPIVDPTNVIESAKRNRVQIEIPGDGHPTREANDLVAKSIWATLRPSLTNQSSSEARREP